MGEERLQKFLAGAGVASRRKAEELILAGRVRVNNAPVTTLGTKIDPERDLVTVDGRPVSRSETRAYYLLYKPAGCVTTASDPEGRPTALDYLRGVHERVFPVGRLDYDAEGAVLFTNDGELANRLAHPRYGHRRVYLVKVRGEPAPEALHRMTTGVRLEDGPAKALEAAEHEHAEKNVWIRVVVGEGRFHLVKRLCEAVGLQVQRLFRPEFGGVTVEGLRPGQFRPLSADELRAMRRVVGLEAGRDPGPARGPLELPRAARRHGHGPPAPPSSPTSAARPVRPAGRAGASPSAPEADEAPDDASAQRRPRASARPGAPGTEDARRGRPAGGPRRGPPAAGGSSRRDRGRGPRR